MFDLVIWSFVIVLTPVTLGLIWKLVSRAGRFDRPRSSVLR